MFLLVTAREVKVTEKRSLGKEREE